MNKSSYQATALLRCKVLAASWPVAEDVSTTAEYVVGQGFLSSNFERMSSRHKSYITRFLIDQTFSHNSTQ